MTEYVRTVMISQGLWTEIPDLDAVRILEQGETNGQSRIKLTRKDYRQSFAIDEGNYTTVCSMNLAFRREIELIELILFS